MHFSDHQRCRTSFQVLTGLLYIFGERFILVYPFFFNFLYFCWFIGIIYI
jgi:hypothetical protein